MPSFPDRIPYAAWSTSNLSVARHAGRCRINGDDYQLDFDTCETKIDENGKTLYFPDLVKVPKPKKEITEEG
jgi:hypothetical protein